MSGRFVRASKYRHVFGRSSKKEQCYDNLRISQNAWDTNLVKANPQYISVNWEASGGGAFAVIPVGERGKLPDRIPLFRGHTAAVLDTDWSPFDDSFIASSSDDGKVLLWKVPEHFTLQGDSDSVQDVKPVSKLSGHSRKVGHVLFNPSANGVLASASGDYSIKIWDVENESPNLTLTHKDIVQSLSWSANGSLLVTTSRDKKLRIWDARQQKPAIEVAGHSGAKNSRAVWLGEHDRIATTGFSKMSDRQLGLWDIRSTQGPVDGFTTLDQISGVCMPFWDEGTQCLYLAGKGYNDGNIRYYEYENDKFEYLSQHSAADPQRGIAFLPKRGVNLHDNEVTRAYRTVNDSFIEPVSFIVPRRAEVFQGDIYPPTIGLKPAMSAKEWFDGKEGMPPKISLESMFEGQAPTEVPSDYKPSATPIRAPSPKAPTPTLKEPKPSQPVAAPVSHGSLRDNQASMASMASKFADKEEDEISEASSFEEIPKPVYRSAASVPAPESVAAPKSAAEEAVVPPSTATTAAPPATPATESTHEPPPSSTPTPTPTASQRLPPVGGGPAEGLRTTLLDIRSMLEHQNQTILAQSEKIDVLTREVQALKVVSGTH